MSRVVACIFLLVTGCLIILACTGISFRYQTDPSIESLLNQKTIYPSAKFMVLSDTHYYDTRLGDSGSAFERVLKRDRKLLLESREIIETAVKEISGEKADFLIVCGDLTKDGEVVNHQRMQSVLSDIAQSGMKVYVVPGNHDVANKKAVRFKGRNRIPVESVSGKDFSEIYNQFGYGQALYRDSNSLSYIAEPIPGLWLLALDSCRWKENKRNGKPSAGGAFSQDTIQWVEDGLIQARKNNKAVIVFMHHGMVEHYPGNEKYFHWYLVQDHREISEMLARYGVSLVFTGHFHAQDITVQHYPEFGRSLFDIETGSLITYPSPYRVVEIQDNQRAIIKSRFIQSIPSHSEDFARYSRDFIFNNTCHLTSRALQKYWVSEQDRRALAPSVANAYLSHLSGDEQKPESILDTGEIRLWGRFIMWMRKDLLEGWYTDLSPSDNFLEIDLATGQVIKPVNGKD